MSAISGNTIYHTDSMAAEDVPEEKELLPEFMDEILYPSALSSFRDTMPGGQLDILVYRNEDKPLNVRLGNMFPFMTLNDIKTALYLEMRGDPDFVPEYVYMCMDRSGAGMKPYIGGEQAPLDFTWNFPSASKRPFRMKNPTLIALGKEPLNTNFVDSGGSRRIVALVNRQRVTIEDAFFKRGVSNGIPVIHAYTYKSLLSKIPGAKPPSEHEWNGRLYQMFPYLSSSSVEPSEVEVRTANRLSTIFSRRQQFLVHLETILSRGEPLINLTVAGVKSLVLRWDKIKDINGIETQFYDASVTEQRPFMRLIPTEGYGISKIFMKDANIPDIDDPKLLIQWSQERSPLPGQDYVFAKILIRRGHVNVPPLYATLQLSNDGNAVCVIQPPKGVKKLEPRGDLDSVGQKILDGLKELPYLKELPSIHQANLVLGIRIRKGTDAIITPRILRERLPIFSSMFQEIPPLPGENPMVMLRFKLVSNFVREDRIQTFITQVIHRKAAKSENILENLVSIVADEFQIDEAEARKQVAIKLRNQDEVAVVVPETKEFMKQNNPGIDIAIFAQHPFYTFHLYNIDSLENFQRIVTALSILMSVDSESLHVDIKSVKELVAAEESTPRVSNGDEESDEEAAEAAEAAEENGAENGAENGKKEKEEEGAQEEESVANAEDLPDYLDFFSADVPEGEEYTEEAKKESDSASKLVAASEGDTVEVEAEKPAEAPKEPKESLKESLLKDGVPPKEELSGVKEVAVPPARKGPAPSAIDDENVGTSRTKGDGIANFFLNKLQEADGRLFEYTKSNPSLKRYVSMCQPTYGRQPAVVSEEKFQEIQNEYEDDNVFFQIYPLQPGEPETPKGTAEVDYYTVLKYGSSPQRMNYYLCCRYFCTRDEMLVREVDLKSTKMRWPTIKADGSQDDTKQPGECPFCRGRVIQSRKKAQAGETIIERGIKPPTQDKRHVYIGFIKKSPHPDGLQLPCCFTENTPLYLNNRMFDKFREWGIGQQANLRPVSKEAEEVLEDDGGEEEPPASRHALEARTILDYYTSLSQIHKKYIVGAEKMPLDIGTVGTGTRGEAQIGLLPTILDTYFDQEATQLVSRAFNPQKIVPGGKGFLRVAVENRFRYQADSFLAAVAPFYRKNTAEDMKMLILDKVMPREFISMNYGNIAIEFYNPTNTDVDIPTVEILTHWASKNLNIGIHEENLEAVVRAYMSYHSFEKWLMSEKTKKEYRQFALLFSQNSLLRESHKNGITFIVLDILKSGKLSVRCPPYGFNVDRMKKNDVAFLLHHWSGIWEPIFYIDNRKPEEREEIFTLEFKYSAYDSWPAIVKERLNEFMGQCSSSGRSIYTSQSKANPMGMIPASLVSGVLSKEVGIKFQGVIRDIYNHLSALVYREVRDETNRAIIIPVIDDGEMYIGGELYLDWDDPELHPAPIDRVCLFYKKYIETNFAYYRGYSPITVIKLKRSGDISAIQMRNLLFVPVGPASNDKYTLAFSKSPTDTIDELEWHKNREIILGDNGSELPGDPERMEIKEFQEIFEHLRLTFANWLALNEGGGEFRNKLEGIIFSRRLPLYEKRKRLEIILSKMVSSWITTDFHSEDLEQNKEVSLLRVDCRVRSQDKCTGKCVWKQGGESGSCMLHVPEQVLLTEESQKVSASRVLLLRLIEELLRYGERRKQLLENNINRLVNIENPVVIPVEGTTSSQVIFPEKSAAWFELLRLEWASKSDEEPRYLEEMSSKRTGIPLAPQSKSTSLPPRLQTILNGGEDKVDPKTSAIRLYRMPLAALVMAVNLTGKDLDIRQDTTNLTENMLRSIVRKTGGSVVQIDLRKDPSDKNMITGARPIKSLYPNMPIPVFVITESGPALLVLDPSSPNILAREDMPAGLITQIQTTLSTKRGVIAVQEPVKKPTIAELRDRLQKEKPTENDIERAVIHAEAPAVAVAEAEAPVAEAEAPVVAAEAPVAELEAPVAELEAPAVAAPAALEEFAPVTLSNLRKAKAQQQQQQEQGQQAPLPATRQSIFNLRAQRRAAQANP